MSEPDLSEFEVLHADRGPQCSVGEIVKVLPPAKRAKLKAALAQTVTVRGRTRISSTAIRRWLEREGYEITDHVLNHHRRGECRCGKARA